MKKILMIISFIAAAAFIFGDDLKQFTFAESLYDSADYYRAIGEYKRYVFYNPTGKYAQKAAFRIGMSYLNAGKYDEAGQYFEALSSALKGDDSAKAVFAAAYSSAAKKDYTYSSSMAGRLLSGGTSGALTAKTNYLMAFNRLSQLEYKEASEYFTKASQEPALKESSENAVKELKRSGDLPSRSAFFASMFSAIVPGTGYFYCGRWGDGVVSMAFNGFFLYNTINAFVKNDGTGKYAYGIPAIVFYISSVYGSAVAAGKFNSDETEKFIRSIENSRVELIGVEF